MGMIDISGENPETLALDVEKSKRMTDVLLRHYPGHAWAARYDSEQGVATIFNLCLSGEMGYVIHTNKMYSASEFDRLTVKAGGEILERFCLKRGAACESAIDSLPTDLSGRTLGDVSK